MSSPAWMDRSLKLPTALCVPLPCLKAFNPFDRFASEKQSPWEWSEQNTPVRADTLKGHAVSSCEQPQVLLQREPRRQDSYQY